MTLEILTEDALLTCRHGFFTRRGGVSTGIYAGLNCGTGSKDAAEAVATNRGLVIASFDLPEENLVSVYQTHSADVLHVDGHTGPTQEKCDAMVTRHKGVALGILTADCQPVLFQDGAAGVIGAAHAGWQGAIDGVLEATVDAMVALGARRQNISAVIGPSLGQQAYEVGPEFQKRFEADDIENNRFFIAGKGDRMLFDLTGFGLHRLRRAGVGRAHWTGHCTYSDPDRFFSYRRATHAGDADYGRLISVIVQ